MPQVLSDATIPELPNHYRGKVRDNYDLPDGRRILISTDRLSAFDIILANIPLKGQVLTQTARYWFERTPPIIVRKSRAGLPGPQRRDRAAASTSCRWRSSFAATSLAPPRTSILTRYTMPVQRAMYGHRVFPRGCAPTRSLPQPDHHADDQGLRRRPRRAAHRGAGSWRAGLLTA